MNMVLLVLAVIACILVSFLAGRLSVRPARKLIREIRDLKRERASEYLKSLSYENRFNALLESVSKLKEARDKYRGMAESRVDSAKPNHRVVWIKRRFQNTSDTNFRNLKDEMAPWWDKEVVMRVQGYHPGYVVLPWHQGDYYELHGTGRRAFHDLRSRADVRGGLGPTIVEMIVTMWEVDPLEVPVVEVPVVEVRTEFREVEVYVLSDDFQRGKPEGILREVIKDEVARHLAEVEVKQIVRSLD